MAPSADSSDASTAKPSRSPCGDVPCKWKAENARGNPGKTVEEFSAEGLAAFRRLEGCWHGIWKRWGGPCRGGPADAYDVCCHDSQSYDFPIKLEISIESKANVAIFAWEAEGQRFHNHSSGAMVDLGMARIRMGTTLQEMLALNTSVISVVFVKDVSPSQNSLDSIVVSLSTPWIKLHNSMCVRFNFDEDGTLNGNFVEQWSHLSSPMLSERLATGAPPTALFDCDISVDIDSRSGATCEPSSRWIPPVTELVDAVGLDLADDKKIFGQFKIHRGDICSCDCEAGEPIDIQRLPDSSNITAPQASGVEDVNVGDVTGSLFFPIAVAVSFILVVCLFIFLRRCLQKRRQGPGSDGAVVGALPVVIQQSMSVTHVAERGCVEAPVQLTCQQSQSFDCEIHHQFPIPTQQSVGSAHIANSGSVQALAELGGQEKWLIEESSVTMGAVPVAQGGFGSVYRGKLHGMLDVAVKTCRQDMSSRKSLSVLSNEVRILRRIRHPNVLLFHGVMVRSKDSREQVCMVVEWVEGGDFAAYVRQSFASKALRHEHKLLCDCAGGVAFLHAQSPPILHLDVKPENMLVEAVAEPPRIKIGDFGLSVLLEDGARKAKAGTYCYMAPEVRANKFYHTPVDAYSFGCVCYFAATAKQPMPETVLALCKQLVTEAHSGTELPLARALEVSVDCLNEEPSLRPTLLATFQRLIGVDFRELSTSSGSISTPLGMSSSDFSSSVPDDFHEKCFQRFSQVAADAVAATIQI